jgi:Rrf2 family protein
MFTKTQEYALRAVVWLAQHHDEGAVDNARIAAGTGVPTSYLSKVLQGLSRAGIVVSKRGVGGGFCLEPEPEELTVLDVIGAVEPLRRITTCPLALKSHKKHLCPMHAQLDEALALVEKTLGNSTIRDVMSEPGRPTPLVESRKRG